MILEYYNKPGSKLYFWKRLLLFPPKVFEKTLVQKIETLSKERFETIKEIIRTNMDEGSVRCQDAQTVAYSFLALIHGLLSASIIYQSEDLTLHYEDIWQNFWKGIN